jgi:hypothetical protein
VSCDVISASNLQSYLASVAQGRLTLTSDTPVLTGNVTGATTIFYTPYIGNQISIWDGNQWIVRTFSELSLSLTGLTANTNYDVFIFDNSGTLTLEAVAWSNSGAGTSARATSIDWLNGVRVKSTDNRKYLGSFRTVAIGQTEFSQTASDTPTLLRPFLVNEFNKVTRYIKYLDVTGVLYSTNTWRLWRNNSNSKILLFNPSTIDVEVELKGRLIASAISCSLNVVTPTVNSSGYFEDIQVYHGIVSSSSIINTATKHFQLSGYNEMNLIQNGFQTGANVTSAVWSIKGEY